MSIKTMLGNINTIWNKDIATKEEVDDVRVEMRENDNALFDLCESYKQQTAELFSKLADKVNTIEIVGEKGPEIDRDFEKEKRMAELMKQVKNPSESQLSWLCDIELDLPEAPKFMGTTQKEVQMYMNKYKEAHKKWKYKNNVSRVAH